MALRRLSATFKCFLKHRDLTGAWVGISTEQDPAFERQRGQARAGGPQEGKDQGLWKCTGFRIFFGCFPIANMSVSPSKAWLELGTALFLNIKDYAVHFSSVYGACCPSLTSFKKGVVGHIRFLVRCVRPRGSRRI